jgi:hypothetical protein
VTDARQPESAAEIAVAAASALLACQLVAIGSCIGGPLRFVLGLPLVLAGFVAASHAMWRMDSERAVNWMPPVCALLCGMAFVGLVAPQTPGGVWYDAAKRVYFVLGLAAVAVFWMGGARVRRRLMIAIAIAATALHLITPLAVPEPDIDVWIWTRLCIGALLSGVHPYTVHAAGVITGVYHLQPTAEVYPYMPLTLVMFTPGQLVVGDYRYISALCLPATIALNRASGHRLGLDARLVDGATLAFLLFPRGSWLTHYGWTEPLLVAIISLFAYVAVRAPNGTGQTVAFLLLPALKQYVMAPVLLLLAIKRPRASAVGVAAAIAAASFVPFLIWDWRATVAGITVQMVAPVEPRLDSISLVALLGRLTGWYASRWLSVIVQGLVAGIAYVKLRRHGLAGVLLASALALLATFLTGWQAFMNYYYFVSEMLLLTAMVCAAQRSTMPRA